MVREDFDKIIMTLSEREQKVIRHRFGFEDNRPHTLEEVGRRLGVTRERIRQYETKALNKLSNSEIVSSFIHSIPELNLMRAIIRYEKKEEKDIIQENLVDCCKAAYVQLEANGWGPQSDLMLYIEKAINQAGRKLTDPI